MTEHKITTRAEAFAANETKYFTGRACSKGHVTHRYTTTGSCCACVRGYASKFRAGAAIKAAGLKEIKLLVDPRDESRIRKAAEAGILAYQFADGSTPFPRLAEGVIADVATAMGVSAERLVSPPPSYIR